VLFLLFGASCAGKTTALAELRRRGLEALAIHDHDEIGVPPAPDTAWRQRTIEEWLRRVLDYQARGVDVVLAGQTPFAELFAEPSAPLLEGAAGCLVDCDDATRIRRLAGVAARDAWWRTTPYSLDDYLSWAGLMRRHARDPQHGLEVIRERAWPGMRWERLDRLTAEDPRWRVHVVDTSNASPGHVADDLAAWIRRERSLRRRAR
jgi:hypothetical protein